MIPENIIKILLDNQKLVTEEIDVINKSITRIEDALWTASGIILQKLLSEANGENVNKESENKCLEQSQDLRTYASRLHQIEIFSPLDDEEHQIVEENFNSGINKRLSINDVIVLKTIKQCSHDNHNIKDVRIQIPVLYDTCQIHLLDVQLVYCKTCNQYYMLKSDFDKISGIILCQVIDQTSISNIIQNDDFSKLQSQSILFRCGYTVSSQRNLPVKARHLILCAVIESHLMTRTEIKDHLNMLIERGSKIPSWKNATKKWEYDKKFINEYNQHDVPQIIFDKVILKYSK